jgi:hypothetical protein
VACRAVGEELEKLTLVVVCGCGGRVGWLGERVLYLMKCGCRLSVQRLAVEAHAHVYRVAYGPNLDVPFLASPLSQVSLSKLLPPISFL